jgi:hypothetical protein
LLRGASDVDEAFDGDALSLAAERLSHAEPSTCGSAYRLRAPIVERLLAVTVGAGRRDGLLVLALLFGIVLAALDRNGYIDILGVSLLALLAWHLIVYALWVANWIRLRALSGARIARLHARWMGSRAAAVLRRSQSFNAPLAVALPRFSTSGGCLLKRL